MVLDIKVGSKLGTGLDRGCRTVVLLDIKVGSKLGTGLDIELCAVVLDIKVGSALDNKLKCCAIVTVVTKNVINSFGAGIGSALGSKLGSKLGIALGTELGTALGTAKSKMNISIPTGNRRL